MVATPEKVQQLLELCQKATQANRNAATRQGVIITLQPDAADELMITGDLHGNRLNFQRLLSIADLANHPRRHLVTQEVCHGGPCYPNNLGCMSHLLLEDVMETKVRFPQQFHFLLSNHELAELIDLPISKGGRMLNLHFRAGMRQLYGDATDQVRKGYMDFIQSCPVAVRTASGVFVSHGSPNFVLEDGFDTGVFQREPSPMDIRAGGLIYRLVWGRDFRQENAAALAKQLGVSVLIHGHEPCEQGFNIPNDLQIILDCCDRNARFVTVPVGEPVTHHQVTKRICRLYDIDHGDSANT